MKGLKDIPNYTIMPHGNRWEEFSQLTIDKEFKSSKILTTTKENQLVRPTLGTIDSVTNIKRGHIQVIKKVDYIGGSKEIKTAFDIAHFIQWKIGRCYQINTGKDFVFPLNIDILKELILTNLGRTETRLYESWAGCKYGIVTITTLPTPMAKQFRLEELLEKYSRQEALALVPQKTTWTFEPDKLTATPKVTISKESNKIIPVKLVPIE